jgi:transcriptional antiterminator RfaH
MSTQWYLLRTKAGEERRAEVQLSRCVADVLAPLMKVRVRRWGRMVESVGPLFPCYLFAKFDLERDYRQVRYAHGVRDLPRFGAEPATVPERVIDELKQRCAGGPVELPKRKLVPDERVKVTDGPFREFEAIFERYLSGQERVAILFSMMGGGARAVLPASMVVPVD